LSKNDLLILFCDYLECDAKSQEGNKVKEYLKNKVRGQANETNITSNDKEKMV